VSESERDAAAAGRRRGEAGREGREAETDRWRRTAKRARRCATLHDAARALLDAARRCSTLLDAARRCSTLNAAARRCAMCSTMLRARLGSPREGTFTLAVLIQVYSKVVAEKAHKAKKASGSKEPFNRYTDELMLAGDRGVGNWLEWAPCFIVLFWLNALLTGENVFLGWVYVAARAAYPLLALMGGIKTSGAKPTIFLSTGPAYAVLIKYAYDIYMAVR
jgi:hypothetical protein